jgi:hypothetical protein
MLESRAAVCHKGRLFTQAFHRFVETANRPISCFDAIPDGKPFRTFPGIALDWQDRQ